MSNAAHLRPRGNDGANLFNVDNRSRYMEHGTVLLNAAALAHEKGHPVEYEFVLPKDRNPLRFRVRIESVEDDDAPGA